MKKNTETVLYVFIALALVFSLTSFLLIVGRMQKVNQPAAANEPARLDVTEIYVQNCSDCYDVNKDLAEIRKQNANVSEKRIEASTAEARPLIDKYRIRKLPALVVTGEINKTAQLTSALSRLGYASSGAVIVEASIPYYSVNESKVVGLVNVTRIIDTSCVQCSSVDVVVNSFKRAGVVIKSDVNLEYNSPQGAELVRKFGVDRIPALIVSKDILEYPAMAAIWPQLNATEKNGSYALHVLQAPYRDLSEGRVVGLVDVIYLNDSSCSNCYNVLVHREILKTNFGIFLLNETVVDVNSTAGKAIVSKYNITVAPIFVMSPEAKYYAGLNQVWPPVGTIESNGWYVFRNVTVLGSIYKNLETGKVTVPAG